MNPYRNVDLSRILFNFYPLPQWGNFGENFDSCLAQSPYSGRNKALSMYPGNTYTLSDALTSIVMKIRPSLCMAWKCVSSGSSEADA